jgi:crotonobetainyl-CoA:carnitine CoA-transferase CaiB-like acyl-CoA transferase
MGADVIKVEPPQGDMGRATPPIRNDESVSFVALNRNKRSLVLDLKRPQAIEILLKLAGKSDVFLEAYRPGALDKLGLGAAAVKAVQPLIIYTSVSGFGQTGPDRRRAGVNLIIEAFSGALSVTGEPGKMPMRPGVQTADVFGALFATYATLAGLVGAARNEPDGGAAFGQRAAAWNVSALAIWENPEEDERAIGWARHVNDILAPLSLTGGGYVNYSPVDESAERVRAAYGDERWARLLAVKRRHDPENVFRFNHNIAPD